MAQNPGITKRAVRLARRTLAFQRETIGTIAITGMRKAEAKAILRQHVQNNKAKRKLAEEQQEQRTLEFTRAKAALKRREREKRITARESKQIVRSGKTRNLSAECQDSPSANPKIVQGGLPSHGRRK